jgi:hypothetical protein
MFYYCRLLEEEERAAAEAAASEKVNRGPRKRKGGAFAAPVVTGEDSAALTQAQILAKAKKEMMSQIKKYGPHYITFEFCHVYCTACDLPLYMFYFQASSKWWFVD